MAKVDLKIKAKDTSGNALTSTISYVNPELTNAQLRELASNLNGLTTNNYDEGQKVTTVNIDSEEDNPKLTPTLKLVNASGEDETTLAKSEQYDFRSYVSYNGDGTVYFRQVPDNSDLTMTTGRGNTSSVPATRYFRFLSGGATGFILYATETNTYKAVSVEYNFE